MLGWRGKIMNRITVGILAGLALLPGCDQSPTIESEPTTAPIVAEPAPAESSPSEMPPEQDPAGPAPTATDPVAEAEYAYGQAASVTVSSYDDTGNPVSMTATVTVGEPQTRSDDYGDGPQQVLYFPITVKAVTNFETFALSFTYTAPDGLTTTGYSDLSGTLYPDQVVREEIRVYHDDGTPAVPGGYLQLEGLLDAGRVIWK
jgi:hypothetical protein